MENINSKIKGSLLGGAIGDALGYQIEFSRGITEKQVTRYFNKGIVSDDTQMTLFTANAILNRETRGSLKGIAYPVPYAIYLGYLDWLDTQTNHNIHEKYCWIKDLEELNVQRAPGNTCLSALSSGKQGTIEEPLNNSKGCGGVMRVAPIGLYYEDIDFVGMTAAEASAITHGHPLGIIPAFVFADMLNVIVRQNSSIEEALNIAMDKLSKKTDVFDKNYIEEFQKLIDKAVKLSKETLKDTEAIPMIGEGWVAEEALAIAVYSCLKYPNSFEDTIVCSINHDGDSDSTGSIAGNIIGASLGLKSIPDYYLKDLELKDVIEELSDDLSIPVPISEYSDKDDEYWVSKYCNHKRDLSKRKMLS